MRKEIYREADLLRDWLSQKGIKAVLSDLDDTIIETHVIFKEQMLLYARYVSFHTGVEFSLLWDDIREINNQAFVDYKVNPNRWGAVAAKLADLHSQHPRVIFEEGIDLLMQIYQIVPKYHEGAEETLALFKTTGCEMGVVTHANPTWTRFKYENLKMDRFLPWERIHIVSEDKYKEPEDWLEAVGQLGVEAQSVLVVGDSVSGDIIAAHKAGIAHRAHVPSVWSVYSQGEIPEGTIKVPGGIGRLVEALIATE